MPAHNPNPPQAESDTAEYFRRDSNNGMWSDTDQFMVGSGNGTQVLGINGFADATIDVGLQAIAPNDSASLQMSLGNILNLSGFANEAASGTVTSAASALGSLSLTNGTLSGDCTATFSIDVTAYIAASHATVQMHITDVFDLSLSGTGYSGVTLAETAASGGSVQLIAPVASNSPGTSTGTFDLARFAASVLNTGQWNLAFAASVPGESLKGQGESVLTISATADVAGNGRSQALSFRDVERSNLAFSDSSSPIGGIYPGLQESSSGPISLFHSA